MARKVKYDFNPFEGLRGEKRQAAKKEIKSFVEDKIQERLSAKSSPVSGVRKFKALSKDYGKFKQSKVGNKNPDLKLTNSLRPSIKVIDNPSGGLRLTTDQQGKADGHNNFTGKSKLPTRPFIPDAKKDQKFKADIERGIKNIVKKHKGS